MKAWLIAFALVGTLFAAPVSAQPVAPTAPLAASAPAADSASEYRLGASDKLRITVYGEPTLTGEYSVSSSGTLSFPLIGDVSAADRTIRDIQGDIERKLAAGYLRKPQVSAEVLTYRPFYIIGEVNRPGQYPYTAGLTVLKAVATASGFTYRANKRKVFIRHGDNAPEQAHELTSATAVAPGDIIRIGERMF